jgi:hypothetical protein
MIKRDWRLRMGTSEYVEGLGRSQLNAISAGSSDMDDPA